MVDTGYCSRYAPNGAQCRQWHQGLRPSGAPQWHGLILLQPAPRAGGGDMLKAKMVYDGTTDVSRWRPTSDLPKLPASLERVMKKHDMLKHVTGEFMIWLLSQQGLQKPGDNGFLGESYPVQRELFVITGKALSSFKGHVSLEEIVSWNSMKSLKNRFQAGSRDLLLPSSGVKAWLVFP